MALIGRNREAAKSDPGETDPATGGIGNADPATGGTGKPEAGNMLPSRRGPRSVVERGFIRLVATTGVIGIAVLLGAILSSNKVQGWIIGLVIGLVSVVLAGMLWSSRQL